MKNKLSKKEALYKRIIIAISILIPLIVAGLFGVKIDGVDLHFLPPIYATINGVTAILLVLAFIAIRMGNKKLHRAIMVTCMALSAVFLGLYVAYHMTSESTPFGGEGPIKVIYFFILITHILLSILVVPLVLISFLRAFLGDFKNHKRLAKYVLPIWFYVAMTGVIVYLLISPYYSS